MTQTISRLYVSASNAASAAAELKGEGFAADAVSVVPAAEAETPDDALVASIVQAGVPAAHAPTYAEGLRRGDTLVSVRAPFGTANQATEILTKFGPIETDLPDHGYEVPAKDPAAPLSSALGWKVLLDDPAPLSSFLRWKTVSPKTSRPIPDSELVDNPAPFSKAVGMEVLSDKPAVLSGHFGWRLLSDNPWPLSTRLGWPLLSKDQKPPASRFGLPLLSDKPAPLSEKLGWSVLSDNPAPLSSKFGWRVLSSDPAPMASWFRRLMS